MINQMVHDALTKKAVTVTGGGVWRPLVSVMDAARAYMLVLMSRPEIVRRRRYNVCDGNYTVLEVARTVIRSLEEAEYATPVLNVQPQPAKVRTYRMSTDRFDREVGWVALDSPAKQVTKIAGRLTLDRRWIENPVERMKCRNIEWMTHLMNMQEELARMGGVF